ncbi:MAG: tqsA 2 [Gemmataceae bacterium]|nr:tqsA 2 [Gemmataceae bacterium]
MARGGYLPDWQRALIALSATVVFTIVVLALYWARTIFIPIALAIFLTFVLSPVVYRLQRRGLGRTTAVVATVALAILLTTAAGVVVTQQVMKLSNDITQPERAAAFKTKIAEAKNTLTGDGNSRLGQLVDDVSSIVFAKPGGGQTPTPVVIQSESPQWLAQLESSISPATEILGQGAFAFILTVFMLLRREDLRNRMIRLTGHGKVTTTTKAVDDASRRISKYLLMQLVVNTTFGVVITVGLLLLGVKLALLWGVIATLMRYIPYIGTWIGLIPPTLFSLAMSEGWTQPILVLALFLGLEAVCNNLVEPRLYGQSMGLSEVAQLVAAGFWAFLWGPVGLILSGPLTVCLLVLGKYVSRFQYLEILLGDEPVLEPKVVFYQRLTARDQDEAAQIALAAAAEADPATVFDGIIIPALCLAKRDQADGDVSAEDVRFVVRAAREIGEEVAAANPPEPTEADHRVRVLLCPARDEADRVGVDLLAALLNPTRWEIEVTADEILASELLIRIGEVRPVAVVIGSLPPGGVAHTRYLVARVRARFPDLKVIIGRWGKSEDFPDDPAQPGVGADWVDTTLADTRKRLNEWYAVFTASEVADDAGEERHGKNQLLGTAAAVNK